ncbi:uncharacterized protein LOC119079013 isoform X2 [Bradysia coprophila]|uniref:uncharacterized protein LOC119079013 isoform X2 n=1 Tax=Bradysia coprophila TaxID=38358 RepID=UPI00187DB7CD|nr:uncharacterized protein LOC119079013 isoform X2 [Bradysia coprophila]
MAVSKFERKLKSLLESEVIHESDFVTYTTYLHDLTKMLLEHENDFPIYANVVKSWISGFEKIFSVKKTNNYVGTFWGTYMSKFCLNVTITLFTFLQYFRQFEPDYTQEFYLHWKTIVSRMDGLKRADTFYNLADKFKIVVQHLRTAASRTEQLAIMAVLRIYIECVPVTQLHRLHEHDNAEIIKVVGRFMENPSILHQHEFLHDINAMGHCIESFKPTKIICRKLNIDMDDTNYSMWFDFNKMEQTINFTTVSLADNANQCFGTARRVKLRESVKVSNLLEINGIWNVISVGNIHSAEQRATIRVYFLNKTEELISTAVKSIFRFVSSGGVTGSASQGFISDYTEAEPTEDECKVSPETAPRLNDSFSSVVPPKLISFERTDSKFSLPTPTKSRRDVPRRNTSLPLLPRHESDESDAELPIKSNLTYVIKNSVTSAENGTPPDHSPASDPNATYVLRESVNPIADEQPEYDYDSQTDNGDNVMDNKCPSMELDADNKSLATNRTYTICIGARSGTLVEANPLAEHDMVLDEDDAYDGNENAQDDSQYGDPYARSSKKIEIIENITIVPPRVQPQSPEPIENFSGASRQNVEYLHFSQVDVSVNRQVFNQYSQPTTRRERFYVKDTSFRSRNIAHIASNESVQRSSQRPIVVAQVKMENFDNSDGRDDQADQSMRSDRKESFVPFTATTKQNTSSHDDCPLNASNGGTHRSQAVSPWPIEFSGNYESFSPITTSTQRTQVKLRKVSYSQQAYSQLSPDPISSPTEQHSAGSSFQKSFFQNSMTLIGLSQENPEALKANKSLNQTEVMPRASGISETPQTINKKIEFNAGIESPSVQASREKSSENVSQNQTAPKLTKCNSIADLPKMSQLHVGPVTESQRELKPLQNESKATQQFTSKQSSTEKLAQSSLQQSIEAPTVDPLAKLSTTDLNSSVQRTKSLSSQIMSVSAPKREQNSKELRATEVTEASPRHSSEKQAATSNQQSIQSVPIIDPDDDIKSSLKAKRTKFSQSSIQSAPVSRPAQMDLNSSVQPTKSLSSLIMSVSAPKREQNSKELRATEVTEASPQHSSEKQAATSNQQSIQKVPIIDPEDDMESSLKAKRSKLSSIQSAPASRPAQMDLNSSVQPTKSLSSQIMSVSAPKREQNSKELRATEVTEASPRHSSQKQAATSSQQLIQSVPIMDPEDDMQSSLKAKRTKFSQSSIQSAPVSRPAQMDLNSSVQPTKSLSSLIMSVSAPKREQNSKELRATEVTEASPQHSSEKQAATSNQQSIQKVPIIDPEDDMESSLKAKRSKLSSIQSAPASRPAQMDLNSSVQPTKSLSSQIMSVSAPKREQNSKELRATEVTEASPRHSSQKQAATSSQQLIQSVPIIYPEDDMESSLKAKRSKLSSIQSAPASQPSQMSAVSQNSTQTPALSLVPQRFENDFTVDLPDDVDCFQPMPNVLQSQAKMSEPQTESTAAKVAPRATISPDNPKASTAIQPKKTAAQKIAKNSAQNKATNATKKLLNPKILREMSAAIVKQPPKGQSKAAPRYSSLTKPTTLNSQRNSENLLTIRFDETDVPDVGNEFAAADNSSNGKTLENDCVNTDGIRVDEEGKVYDDNGCVFANNAEFQRAAKFYIANDGLDFLKKETVTALPASKRQKYERRLKTIQRMIDRGLERLRVGQKKITDIDPYAVTIAETTIQGEKRKRKYKEVSVTTSRKTYVDKAKQVTYTKRTSKMHYVFDEGTSTDSKSTMSKAMSRSKAFSKAKTAQTVKTSYPSSANLAEGKVKSRQNGIISNPSNRPDAKPSSNRLEFDQTPMVSMNEYCAEVNVSPIPASSEIDAGQHKPHKDISAISAGKMSLPIYASQKMVAVHQQKMLTKTICQPPQHHDESPSTNIDCSGDASTNRTAMTGVELCSTTKCAGNMKELLDYLNRIEMESSHTCRGSCERNQNTLKTFIDRLRRKEFHQDRGVSDWEQLFNCLLESLESMCNTASDRLQVHEGESNGQAI